MVELTLLERLNAVKASDLHDDYVADVLNDDEVVVSVGQPITSNTVLVCGDTIRLSKYADEWRNGEYLEWVLPRGSFDESIANVIHVTNALVRAIDALEPEVPA